MNLLQDLLSETRVGAAQREAAESPRLRDKLWLTYKGPALAVQAGLEGLGGAAPAVEVPTPIVRGAPGPEDDTPLSLPPMKRPEFLRPLFGENLEHWDETPSQMLETPAGRERAKQWLGHAHNDPGYAKRRQELEAQIEDKSARYATMITEYRNARRQDARGFAPSHAADMLLTEAAFTALPAGRVFQAMEGAGATRAAARAAAIKEAGLPLAMMGGAAHYGGRFGMWAAQHPRATLGLAGTAAGAGAFGGEGSLPKALLGGVAGALGGQALLRGAQHLPASVVEMGSRMSRAEAEFAAKAWRSLSPHGDLAAHGIGEFRSVPLVMQNAFGGALAAGIVGAEPATALLTGVATAAGVRALPEVVSGTARGWRMGRLLVRGEEFRSLDELVWGTAANPTRPFHQDAAGALSAVGRALSYVKPLGWLRGALDDPEWLSSMEKIYQHTEELDRVAEGFGERTLKIMEDGGWLGSPEVLTGIRRFLPQPIAQAMAQAQGAQRRVERLAPLMEETPSWAMVSEEAGFRYREAMRLRGYSDKEIKSALEMRELYDEFATGLVDRGVITEDELVDNFLPRILDRKRYWKSFADAPRLLDPGYVAGLNHRIGKAMARSGTKMKVRFPGMDGRIHEFDSMGLVWAQRPNTLARSLGIDQEGHIIFTAGERLAKDGETWKPLAGRRLASKKGPALGKTELDDLIRIAHGSREFGVTPRTTMKILSDGRLHYNRTTLRHGVTGAGSMGGTPSEVFLSHALERQGSKLPFHTDPLETSLRYFKAASRKVILDELLAEGGLIERFDKRFGPKGIGADYTVNAATDVIRSAIGAPTKASQVVDDFLRGIFHHPTVQSFPGMKRVYAPGGVNEAIAAYTDMLYAGLLGRSIATPTRNLFQGLLTSTAVGPRWLVDGMLEFSRNPKKWTETWHDMGVIRTPYQEIADQMRTASTIGEDLASGNVWRARLKSLWHTLNHMDLKLFHESDTFNRTRAATAGYMKAMAQKAKAPLDVFRKDAQGRLRAAMAEATAKNTEEAWHAYALLYGKEVSDLTQFVYGRQGSPLGVRGTAGQLVGMFKTWPLNYMDLLSTWARNGRSGDILRMGIAATILDTTAYDHLGIQRLTGLSPYGTSQGRDNPWSPFGGVGAPASDFATGLSTPATSMVGRGIQVGAQALIERDVQADALRDFSRAAFAPFYREKRILEAAEAIQAGYPEYAITRLMGWSTRPDLRPPRDQ